MSLFPGNTSGGGVGCCWHILCPGSCADVHPCVTTAEKLHTLQILRVAEPVSMFLAIQTQCTQSGPLPGRYVNKYTQTFRILLNLVKDQNVIIPGGQRCANK